MSARETESGKRAHAPACLIPLWHAYDADRLPEAVDLYAALRDGPGCFVFETAHRRAGDGAARLSVIGFDCVERIELYEGLVRYVPARGPVEEVESDDPIRELRGRRLAYAVPVDPELPDLGCGMFGYFGFETVRLIEPRLRRTTRRTSGSTLPDACLWVPRRSVVLDHSRNRVFCIVMTEAGAGEASAAAELDALVARVGDVSAAFHPAGIDPGDSVAERPLSSEFPKRDYCAGVDRILDYIAEGDVMQVVLSRRMTRPFRGDAVGLYRALTSDSQSPYRYLIDLGDEQIVGASPEMLFRLHEGRITSRPLAGTRRRGVDPEEDRALEEELLADAKEVAEHAVLVDLARNDLGRVAAAGTVEVERFLDVERFPSVMHIASRVTATLAEDLTAEDVLRATFPAGTLSGASKVRALEVIAEIEPHARGIYGGAIGMLGWNGDADLAIAIRTVLLSGGLLHMQVGAGVVRDSCAEREWQETLEKSQGVLRAAARAEAASPQRRGAGA